MYGEIGQEVQSIFSQKMGRKVGCRTEGAEIENKGNLVDDGPDPEDQARRTF